LRFEEVSSPYLWTPLYKIKVLKISEALDENTEYTMARRKRTTDTTMVNIHYRQLKIYIHAPM
jgi:hypothetical protein